MGVGGSIIGALAGIAQTGMSMAGNKRQQRRAQEYNLSMNQVNFAQQQHLMQLNQDYNSAEALKSRKFASGEALKSREFSERMARNKTQYAMEDMRAAGLNPILAAGGALGGGAPSSAQAQSAQASAGGGSSGGGSGAHAQGADYSGISKGVASAIQAALVKKQMKQLDAATKLVAEQANTEKSKQFKNYNSQSFQNLITGEAQKLNSASQRKIIKDKIENFAKDVPGTLKKTITPGQKGNPNLRGDPMRELINLIKKIF